MGNIGLPELIVILVIALLVFGAGRLPEVGAQIGKGIKEFKKAMKDDGEGKKK
ncbi:MAG: twin-arginine translocase TatA/TatE family subunit [Candidatus Firestonebacteria bacterium]